MGALAFAASAVHAAALFVAPSPTKPIAVALNQPVVASDVTLAVFGAVLPSGGGMRTNS